MYNGGRLEVHFISGKVLGGLGLRALCIEVVIPEVQAHLWLCLGGLHRTFVECLCIFGRSGSGPLS